MTLTALRDLLEDERVWGVAARVALHEGESSHFTRSNSGQIAVSVLTNNHSVPLWALLKAGDGDGHGIWRVPSIGTEVFVCFEQGDFDNDCYVVGIIGSSPGDLQERVTLIVDDTVEIRRLDGTAERLPTWDDFNALRSHVDGHTHTYAPGPSAPVQTTPPSSIGATPDPSPTPSGTTVLKAQ